MAGAGAKLFTSGSVLTADQVNTYLMDQTIMKFTSTTARDAAFGGAGEPSLSEGMFAYTTDTNTLWLYDGSNWVSAVNAASLNGVGTSAVSFTPTFTNYTRGNGITTSYYMQINKLVYVYVREVLGSTSSVTGSVSMALPITAARVPAIEAGRIFIEDPGINLYLGTIYPVTVSSVDLQVDVASGTFLFTNAVNATTPMTWGTNDNFTFAFVYEAA